MTGLPRICLSVTAAEAEVGLPQLGASFLLELRLDSHPATTADLLRLLALSPWTLATCRPGVRSEAECGEVLLRALAAGATLVDLDRTTSAAVLQGVAAQSRRLGRKLVVSHHDFDGTPSGDVLCDLVEDCFSKGADIAKLACMAVTPEDNRRMMALYDGEARPLVAFCMGQVGRPTRMQALGLGAPFMYGSAGPGRETALGQVEAAEMVRILGVHEDLPNRNPLPAIVHVSEGRQPSIAAESPVRFGVTARPMTEGSEFPVLGAAGTFAVAGAPILHSRSPAIHQAVFSGLGLPWRYTRVRAARPDMLRRVMQGVPLSGVNLTAPLKLSCLPLADTLEKDARDTGAVNTLVLGPGGRWIGANTDGEGVLGALVGVGAVLAGRPAVVLGAGGAARSAARALVGAGCAVTVVNRTAVRAQALARDLGCAFAPWGGLRDVLRCGPVVVSALPALAVADVPAEWLEPGSVLLDADYAIGDLGRRAAGRGCTVATGLDWLAWQAMGVARRFTGRDIGIQTVRDALAASSAMPPQRIALVGFMGAGKSVVAARVAASLGWDVVETDELLETRFGRPVARIFADEGEAAFRMAESEVLRDLASRQRVVVSCGGGLPAHGDNSAVLRDLFAGFWLHVSLETAMARAGDDPARPLLHGAPRERLAGLLESRTDAYVASSRVIVDAEEGSADTVAEGIFDEVRRALAG